MRSTSIVIPVFNRAHLVHRAIDSALEQSVPCEVVLVDHGSTDDIGAIVKRYKNRIRYVRREQDRGAVAAWRDGVEQATGELVHLTYDDDWIQPAFVERCEVLLRPDVAFVYTRAMVRDQEGKPIELLLNAHPPGIRPIGDIVNYLMRMPLGISPGCCLFRRSDALRNLLPDMPGPAGEDARKSGAGIDLLLLLLTSLHYPRYGHVAETLADFLAHPGSITIGAQLAGRIEKLEAVYSAAKAYYLQQPGARKPSPLRTLVSRSTRGSVVRDSRRDSRGGPMYFSPHFPWPPRHGAHHRIVQTLRWMVDRYGPVHLVVGRQSNDNGRSGAVPRELVSRLTFLDLEPSLPEDLLRRYYRQSVVDRTTWSARRSFGRLLRAERPRVVFFNYVYWGRLLPRERDFFAIIDTHDVVSHTEHLLRRLDKLARADGDAFAEFERESSRLDRRVEGAEREVRTLDAFDVVLAISRDDQAFLAEALRRPRVVKLGYHVPRGEALPALRTFERARGLCPVGPNLFNEMGLRALVREFDQLQHERAYVTLTGALYPYSTLSERPWFELRGLVRDYPFEIATHQFGVMVAFTGTGAQIKQYEFAHAGVPVVGYTARTDIDLFTNGVDAVTVDHPREMCRAIIRLADDPDYLSHLTAAARNLPQRLRELRVREESALQALVP